MGYAMRDYIQSTAPELPRVVGARRLLACGRLGAELVRLAEAAAEMDRERASRLAGPELAEPTLNRTFAIGALP